MGNSRSADNSLAYLIQDVPVWGYELLPGFRLRINALVDIFEGPVSSEQLAQGVQNLRRRRKEVRWGRLALECYRLSLARAAGTSLGELATGITRSRERTQSGWLRLLAAVSLSVDYELHVEKALGQLVDTLQLSVRSEEECTVVVRSSAGGLPRHRLVPKEPGEASASGSS